MAVPKKRTGHSAQGKRRSNWKATKPTTTKCPNCGAVALAHTVCTACGQYKGKVVSRKAEGFVETTEVKEAKKAPKKSTKKDPVVVIDQPKKSSGLSLAVIIILTIILGAAVGAGAYFLLPK